MSFNPLDPFLGTLSPDEAFKRRLDEFFRGLSPDSRALEQAQQSKPKLVGLGRRSTSTGTRTFSGSPRRELTSIMSEVEQDREVKINKPTSYRYYDLNSSGQKYHETSSGDKPGVSLDEYQGSRRESIPSTCVKSIKYRPSDQHCWIQFHGGDKWYVFKVSPEQFQDFLDSSSKGRHTNWVLKRKFRAPKSWYK